MNKRDKVIIAWMFNLLSQMLVANNIDDTSQSTWACLMEQMTLLNNDIDRWLGE